MTDICLIIKGAKINLTPKPHKAMNGSHGIPHPACILINALAVAENKGAPHAHIKGKLYTLGGLYAKFSAAAATA